MLIVFIVKLGWLVDAILSVRKLIECFWVMCQKSCRLWSVNLFDDVKYCKRGPSAHEANDRIQVRIFSKKTEQLTVNRHGGMKYMLSLS